jgi:hypothetical protein
VSNSLWDFELYCVVLTYFLPFFCMEMKLDAWVVLIILNHYMIVIKTLMIQFDHELPEFCLVCHLLGYT